MLNYTYSDNKFWKIFTEVFQKFNQKKLPNLNVTEKARIKRLRNKTGSSYEFNYASESEKGWKQIGNEVNKRIQEFDPREFYRWKCIQDSMAVSNSMFIIEEYKRLKKLPFYETRYKKLLTEPGRFYFPRFIFKNCSGNTVHHSYLLSLFENTAGLDFSDFDVIVEFGGGYGNLCRLIHLLGFNKKYFIYDLSTFSYLQEFFLTHSGLDVTQIDTANLIDYSPNQIFCTTNSSLISNYIERTNPKQKILFIGTWSLSEAPIEIRDKFENVIKHSNAVLFAYQNVFGEVDNIEYFKNIVKQNKRLNWIHQEIDYLKCHNLLFGISK